MNVRTAATENSRQVCRKVQPSMRSTFFFFFIFFVSSLPFGLGEFSRLGSTPLGSAGIGLDGSTSRPSHAPPRRSLFSSFQKEHKKTRCGSQSLFEELSLAALSLYFSRRPAKTLAATSARSASELAPPTNLFGLLPSHSIGKSMFIAFSFTSGLTPNASRT